MAGNFLENLARLKLLVVTGKGGAGKSVLSLALAHRLSCLGRKVWLIEQGRRRDLAFSRLPELLEVPSIGHDPVEVPLPGSVHPIRVSVLDPTRCLAEYVDLKLPTGGLAGLLLNNRVTASLLEVVPGLPDLVTLGKIWHSLTTEKEDLVIVDAPASGHAISFLEAPENFRRLTRKGPIFRDAEAMTAFLADPSRTGIVLTTLPEEMSVQETIELRETLAKRLPRPFLVVNKAFPPLPDLKPGKGVVWSAYAYARKRSLREKESILALGKEPREIVPFLFPEEGRLFLRISEALP